MRRGVGPVWIPSSDFWCLLAMLFLFMVQEKKPPHAGTDQNAEYMVTLTWDADKYDADLDLWLVTPPHSVPVFFGNRQEGCVALDQDNRGWTDSQVTNADGSVSKSKTAKETIALRCRQTGHYDVGVNFYGYHPHENTPPSSDHIGIRAHVEVIKLNPVVTTVFDKPDVIMNSETQITNVVSFDLLPDGDLKFTDLPLKPVTSTRNNK